MNAFQKVALGMVALSCILYVGLADAQSSRNISLGQLEEMFNKMRANTKWNVDGDLLWGYFFFDPNPEKLQHAADELKASGYRIADITPDAKRQTYRLHVEKIETHSPSSLNSRNQEFYALAEKYNLASYDGMDVGPVPSGSR